MKVVLSGLVFAAGQESAITLADRFTQQVDRRLTIPEVDQQRYGGFLGQALDKAGLGGLSSQYIVVADRNRFVQAVMIFWKSADGKLFFIGASPASTGKPGQYEHFETPLGIYRHSVDNPDFRAEGTRNEFGIRGYGRKGMRVYDFGWVRAPKGWGDKTESVMRLQMHATDPDILERRLGIPQSEGCIRVPATFNTFIDHYGILDEDYERAIAAGKTFFVLSRQREPTKWSGQYLVIVDSGSLARPAWSPLPRF